MIRNVADYELYGELSKAVLLLQEKGVLEKIQTVWWKQKKGGGACTVCQFDVSVAGWALGNQSRLCRKKRKVDLKSWASSI